jgi:uncharacterized OB-fold protein
MAQLDVTLKPLPTPSEVSAPYWHGLKEHRVLMQRCTSCNRLQFYPRSGCRSCGGTELVWDEMSGRGTVYSYTVIHRAPFAAFAKDVPYVYALIALDEGPRVIATIDTDIDRVEVDMPVQAIFDDVTDEITLLRFSEV